MLGILLIAKPLGITSHDVVNQVRRKLGTRRVGHAGTLDPLGTGLLVVAVGPATRFLQYLSLEPKEYVAEITFGQSSNTQDAEGELSDPLPIPENLGERLQQAIPGFVGSIEQLPPMYSAVKIKGKALYHYARKGQEVARETRAVRIDEIEVTSIQSAKADLRVVCSGGTYMRTLAHDLGQAVDCGAYLSGLSRTRCGVFELGEAVDLVAASEDDLLSLEEAIEPMPILTLNAVQAGAIRQGRRIGWLRPVPVRFAAVKEAGGDVFGVVQVAGSELQPECVLPTEVLHGVR